MTNRFPYPPDPDPDLEEDYFEYLDMLRESGVTNMYGAGPYLQREFGLKKTEAHAILGRWMWLNRGFYQEQPR